MTDFYDDPSRMEPSFQFYRVRTVGDTLGDTFDFVRRHFREMFGGLLVIVGPLLLVQTLVAASFQGAWLDAFTTSGDAFTDPDTVLGFYGDFGVRIAVTWLASLLAYAFMTAATFGYMQLVEAGRGGTISPAVLWEATKPNILPLLWISLLSVLIVIVGAVVNVLPCLGTLAWLIGFVYLMPVFWIWQPARVFGGGTVARAFVQARQLVHGQWGPTFGVLFVLIVVMIAVGIAVALPFSVLGFVLGAEGDTTGPLARLLLLSSTVLGGLAYFVYVLAYVGATLHYFNLVERSDSVDLARRVDDLDDLDPPAEPAAW
ncbi:MAG: hypothetical protein AAGG50_06040 [Bacteroidota bacterium]